MVCPVRSLTAGEWGRIAFWAVLFCFFYSATTEGELKPITLSLSPQACVIVCEVEATIVIPPHLDNRIAALVWIAGSSEWDVKWNPDGSVPSEFHRIIAFYESGDYDVSAVLLRTRNGKRQVFHDDKTVFVRGGS